jgi:hypothetical protein
MRCQARGCRTRLGLVPLLLETMRLLGKYGDAFAGQISLGHLGIALEEHLHKTHGCRTSRSAEGCAIESRRYRDPGNYVAEATMMDGEAAITHRLAAATWCLRLASEQVPQRRFP